MKRGEPYVNKTTYYVVRGIIPDAPKLTYNIMQRDFILNTLKEAEELYSKVDKTCFHQLEQVSEERTTLNNKYVDNSNHSIVAKAKEIICEIERLKKQLEETVPFDSTIPVNFKTIL